MTFTFDEAASMAVVIGIFTCLSCACCYGGYRFRRSNKRKFCRYSRPKTFETHLKRFRRRFYIIFAHLAQSVERKTFNLVAVGSTPTVGTSKKKNNNKEQLFISSLVQVVRILRFHRRDSGSSPEWGTKLYSVMVTRRYYILTGNASSILARAYRPAWRYKLLAVRVMRVKIRASQVCLLCL